MLGLRAFSRSLPMLAGSAIVCGASWAQSQSANVAVPKSSAVPNQVRFQGSIRDQNGKVLSGVAGVTFALYQEEQGGVALWIETQNVQADATGRYNVSLGANKPLPVELFSSSEARWLAAQVAGQKEQNRILLLSVPYALKAADAETVGGLPPSAFVLAGPPSGGNGGAASALSSSSTALTSTTIVGTGTTNFLPIWTNATTLANSALFQMGTGAAAKVGIGNIVPAAALDVSGGAFIRGTLVSPATGVATATKGFNSNPRDFVASVFNTSAAVNQTFRFQAEPVGNHTAAASGTLNLLYGAGAAVPAETGLKISNKGLITFATGQTFPGAGGSGTVTSVGLSAPSSDFTVTGSNGDFRYQLTAIGAPGLNLYIADKIRGNRFRVAGGAPAKTHPQAVEVEKTGEERGLYLHPEAFGQPLEKGISALHARQQQAYFKKSTAK